jgi:hypothetical protein
MPFGLFGLGGYLVLLGLDSNVGVNKRRPKANTEVLRFAQDDNRKVATNNGAAPQRLGG